MVIKQYKTRPYGNPNFNNASQTSNPRTPEEKVQAISDLLEVRLQGLIAMQYGERALMIRDMQYAGGTDGSKDLKTYRQQLENDFSGMTNVKQQTKTDKDQQPELKKVSTKKKVDIATPGSKGFGGGQKNSKSKK
ncbi:hypothetical protein [Okeania sp. KiyG1]|uniref:hypothetical protein n=1 Tax=Okeania sp. KiyG1 TaxID=2720165 RepID=UPI001924CD1E|nr:hypothetical protein [Okeania sp. KiyG1]GGA55989.1 hypothetical protein CYANOKiyG1_76730 [Okeania sp. KiyG1]